MAIPRNLSGFYYFPGCIATSIFVATLASGFCSLFSNLLTVIFAPMELSGIKLIAADMDGTLLDAGGELDKDFYSLFGQLKRHGILFAAASGRQFFNLRNKFSPVSEEMAFIAENGSYLSYKGRDIFVQAMDPSITKELIRMARKIEGTYIILSGKKKAYIENTNPEFMHHVNIYCDRREVVTDLLQVEDDEFLKIAICDFRGSENNSFHYFSHLQDRLQVKISGKIWLDLSHLLANKGTALEMLQKDRGITANETMVFGDYLNDLEMMQQAYFSYAMENAHPDIKKVSRFRAKANTENGVGIVLAELLNQFSNA